MKFTTIKTYLAALAFVLPVLLLASCSKDDPEPEPVVEEPEQPEPAEPEIPELHGWTVDTINWKSTGGFVTNIERTDDGKFIIANYKAIARLNSDGSHDASFPNYTINGDGGIFNVQLDGDQILVMGSFRNFNGTEHDLLVRLNSDGSIDNTFKVPFYFIDEINPVNQMTFTDSVRRVAIRDDNSYVLAGRFSIGRPYKNTLTYEFIRNLAKVGKGDAVPDYNYANINSGKDQPYYGPFSPALFQDAVLKDLYVYEDNSVLFPASFNHLGNTSKLKYGPDGIVDESFKLLISGLDNNEGVSIDSYWPLATGDVIALGTGNLHAVKFNPITGAVDNTWHTNLDGDDGAGLYYYKVIEFSNGYIAANGAYPIFGIGLDGHLEYGASGEQIVGDNVNFIHHDFQKVLKPSLSAWRTIMIGSRTHDLLKLSETEFIAAGQFVYQTDNAGNPSASRGLLKFVKK